MENASKETLSVLTYVSLPKGEIVHLDEYENEELSRIPDSLIDGSTVVAIGEELKRVESVQVSLCTTGIPLTYWFEREEILRSLIYNAA